MTAGTAPAAPVAAPRGRRLPAPQLTTTLRRSLGERRMQIGLVCAGVPLFLALFGPLLAPHTATELVGRAYADPGAGHLLGTDYLGRDVLSRVLHGGRSVLWMAVAATTIGMIFGVSLGMIAGYARSRLDGLIMRSLDILMAFPHMVLVFLVVSMWGTKLWLIVLLVAIAWTPAIARVTRGITMETTSREFVDAAEVIGIPRRRILASEVLPNLTTPLMVEYGLRLTWSIGLMAAISFLGYGIQPPAADWGLMVNENRNALAITPWPALIPIICIAFFTVGTNLMTEGIARTIAGVGRATRR